MEKYLPSKAVVHHVDENEKTILQITWWLVKIEHITTCCINAKEH